MRSMMAVAPRGHCERQARGCQLEQTRLNNDDKQLKAEGITRRMSPARGSDVQCRCGDHGALPHSHFCHAWTTDPPGGPEVTSDVLLNKKVYVSPSTNIAPAQLQRALRGFNATKVEADAGNTPRVDVMDSNLSCRTLLTGDPDCQLL